MDIKRIEWGNRLVLENYGLNYRPLFVTCTYSPENLPENFTDCVKYCQRWIKRLRRRLDGPVRYFLVTENGSKNGRLHQHLIMWIPTIAHLSDLDKWKILYDSWGAGRLELTQVETVKALFYTTKYITKNLTEIYTDKSGYVWSRYENAWVKPGRLYTWSNKPRLGDAGINRWEYLTTIWNENYPGQKPPNWFHAHILGQSHKCYIPKSVYINHVQGKLGINLRPPSEEDKTVEKLDDETRKAIIEAWQEIEESQK